MGLHDRINRSGSTGFGIPAMTDPTTMIIAPATIALIVPEMLNPAINSNFVMGVTR